MLTSLEEAIELNATGRLKMILSSLGEHRDWKNGSKAYIFDSWEHTSLHCKEFCSEWSPESHLPKE